VTKPTGTCSSTVYRGPWSRGGKCSRNGSIERNGRLYCKQHDPVHIAEERKKEEEEWKRLREEAKANRCPHCGGSGRKPGGAK